MTPPGKTRTASCLAAIAIALFGLGHPAGATVPAQIHVAGTLVLHVTLTPSVAIANGAQVQLSVSINTVGASHGSASDIYKTTTVTNRQAVATITIPYKWVVASMKDQVAIQVYANAAGSGPYSVSGDSNTIQTTIALPANGATTNVPITGAI